MILQLTVTDTLQSSKGVALSFMTSSIWFWIALVEFLIILVFIVMRKKKPDMEFAEFSKEQLRKSQGQGIDMNNVLDSINKAGPLYKELSRVCHPDRFQDLEKKKIADELFQEISSNKRNYQKLLELKEKSFELLNLNSKT